ncbi:MAG: hypothetical protein BGO69_17185 [Bacteroidetes bacterium 46-16]|nr:MAG: hypothetical protein BGO69_17185 [Bacteroidetes bacterium 46-16]
MPKSYSQSIRFNIIDRELRRWPSVNTVRLVKVISEYLGKEVKPRTIQKDIEAMRYDPKVGYHAPIEYDSKKRAYRYTDNNYSITKFNLRESELRALKFYAARLALYSGYSIFDDFSSAIQKVIAGLDIKQKLAGGNKVEQIIQTDTVPIVRGNEYISSLVEAIVEKQIVSFDYQKFNDNETSSRIVAPYFLKEFKNRWYLICKTQLHNNIAIFGLDRMSNVKVLDEKYSNIEAFDPENYFKFSFGITTPDDPVEKIIIWFSKQEAPYIRSLPIHATQTTVKDNRNGLTISIKIIPSYEFYEFILGKTPDVKIISPKHIADKVCQALKAGCLHY